MQLHTKEGGKAACTAGGGPNLSPQDFRDIFVSSTAGAAVSALHVHVCYPCS